MTTVELRGGGAAALDQVPVSAGVAQILGPDGANLLIGRPANLRRWLASHLGSGPPPRKSVRPPLDLSPVATAVRHAATTSSFQQRLLYERLMACHVAASARRDLRPPAYLRLDCGERLPRLRLRGTALGEPRPEGAFLFGPFRDRRAAARALEALHKRFPLRPCDYVFEPAPELPLGLGCVYAQMRTCSAPCLVRVTEEAYRQLAREAAALLAAPASRPPETEAWLPSWVGETGRCRGVVVEAAGDEIEVYPVRDGAVLEESSVAAPAAELESKLAALAWPQPPAGRDDRAWLLAWLHAPRRSGAYLAVGADDSAELARRLRDVIR